MPTSPIQMQRMSSSELGQGDRVSSVSQPVNHPVLSMTELSVVRGGTSILESVSFRVSQGEVVLLTGDNGAGKTTLIKAILGLLPLSAGRVVVFGSPVGSRLSSELSTPETRPSKR